MAQVKANGLSIEVETDGDPANPALVLVNGLGGQLTDWEPGIVDALVERGFFVVRFDNRDAGLSEGVEGPTGSQGGGAAGLAAAASYTLWDVADDLAGVLDALSIDAAHLVGVSMGGMIVQATAIRHPDRVRSVCSIMSTTGARDVGMPTPEGLQVLMTPGPQDREGAIEHEVGIWKVIGSPGYPMDDDLVRRRSAASYDRAFRPAGVARQLMAVLATGDRTEALHGVRVPTLVVHGEADVLIGVSGGRATAAAIPGARLMTYPGMGHHLPEPLWPEILDAIAENAARPS